MKIDLFLQGKRVELNKDIDFVLNKQFTELTDLTTIIVDYSKTIKVPMTPHNNELFNYVYRLDRQVISSQQVITYDPSQKIDMYMSFNGSKVMDGYALLNNVDLKNKVYEINLYGQLGKIFSDLKDKTLTSTPGYRTPNNGWSKTIRMNTYNINKSFASILHSTAWWSQDWADFYGFAPQMIGDTDSIQTDCYEVYNPGTEADHIVKMEDAINTTRGITYADTYVKGGMDVNQYGEIRTYMCRPYVYVDKIIQMVQNEINQGDYDGYRMILDEDWFNNNNPYWKNMVFFPGNESLVDSGDSSSGYVSWDNSYRTMTYPSYFMPNTTDVALDEYTYSVSNNVATISYSGTSDAMATLTLKCTVKLKDRITGVSSAYPAIDDICWGYKNLVDNPMAIPIRYLGVYDGDKNLIYKLYMCPDTIWSVVWYDPSTVGRYHFDGVWNKLKVMNVKNVVPVSTVWDNTGERGNYLQVEQVYNFGDLILNSNSFTFKMGCDIIDVYRGQMITENVSNADTTHMSPFARTYTVTYDNDNSTWTQSISPIPSLEVAAGTYRSGYIWSINDILGNDFNPFTWLIDYVKQFRLYFDIDYNTKTITLKKGYFNNVTYKEVTVDYDKGMVVEPIIDKYHTVEFGYKRNESRKSALYFKNNGVNYGDIKIDTGLDINNETLSLIPNKDFSVFIPTTLNGLTFNNLNTAGSTIVPGNRLGTNKVINTLDKDGKIQYFPFYAFRVDNLSTGSVMLDITDDTPYQKNTGKYCYLKQNTAANDGWYTEVQYSENGHDVYYAKRITYLPQFDNYISKDEGSIWRCMVCGYQTKSSQSPTVCPNCGAVLSFIGLPDYKLYWDTFNVPKEVYNGYLPFNTGSKALYDQRWQNYLNEIFNIHNNKVTCYVRLSYPEFINFKFNQLFVIDNVTFLVNKIIDFNPNSQGPTKVELIEISDPGNLQ